MKIIDKIRKMVTSGDSKMNKWNLLTDENQLPPLLGASHQRAQLIYKHSHKCSTCYVAKRKIEASFKALEKQAEMHFVNVIKSRAVSTALAEKLDVHHESPQVLLIKDGACVWHASHWSVTGEAILEALDDLKIATD